MQSLQITDDFFTLLAKRLIQSKNRFIEISDRSDSFWLHPKFADRLSKFNFEKLLIVQIR